MTDYPDDTWECTCGRTHQWWVDCCDDCGCSKKERISDSLPDGEKDVWDD